MTAQGFDRRTFLQLGAAALVLGGTAAGCGNPTDKRIKFFNWQDYIDPNLLADFEKASGLRVSYSTYASNDELGDRLALAGVPRRGNRPGSSFDLIVPSANLFRRLRDQNRLAPLDSKIVTEALLGGLDAKFRTSDADPGNRFAIPWATGSTGIGYDTRVFPEPPTWDVFLNSAHAGKMTLLDEKREAFAAAQFSLGSNPNSTDAGEIGAAEKRLLEMKANAAFDAETYLAKLTSGASVASQAFSSDVLQAQKTNKNLAFVVPKAGGTRWTDLLCIPSNAANVAGANTFIAFYLDAKVAAQNAVSVKIDTGNAATRPILPAEILNDPVIYPSPEVEARLVFLADLGATEEVYNAAWKRVRG